MKMLSSFHIFRPENLHIFGWPPCCELLHVCLSMCEHTADCSPILRRLLSAASQSPMKTCTASMMESFSMTSSLNSTSSQFFVSATVGLFLSSMCFDKYIFQTVRLTLITQQLCHAMTHVVVYGWRRWQYQRLQTKCIVLSLWLSHCESWVGSYDKGRLVCQMGHQLIWAVSLPVGQGYRRGSPTAVQLWKPCPLCEPSASYPVVKLTRGFLCFVLIVLLYFLLFCFFWVFFTFVVSFPSVLWYCWLGLLTCKTVSQITYTVLAGTLNTAQSINQSICLWLLPSTPTIVIC